MVNLALWFVCLDMSWFCAKKTDQFYQALTWLWCFVAFPPEHIVSSERSSTLCQFSNLDHPLTTSLQVSGVLGHGLDALALSIHVLSSQTFVLFTYNARDVTTHFPSPGNLNFESNNTDIFISISTKWRTLFQAYFPFALQYPKQSWNSPSHIYNLSFIKETNTTLSCCSSLRSLIFFLHPFRLD